MILGFLATILTAAIFGVVYHSLAYVQEKYLKEFLFVVSGVILLSVGFGLVYFFQEIGWFGSVHNSIWAEE